jgi:hypothetical protein
MAARCIPGHSPGFLILSIPKHIIRYTSILDVIIFLKMICRKRDHTTVPAHPSESADLLTRRRLGGKWLPVNPGTDSVFAIALTHQWMINGTSPGNSLERLDAFHTMTHDST